MWNKFVNANCIIFFIYYSSTEKDNGRLCIPYEDLVVKICKIYESIIRQHQGLGIKSMNRLELLKFCLFFLLRDKSIFKELRTTCTDDHKPISDQIFKLLEQIVNSYSTTRLHHCKGAHNIHILYVLR